MSFVNEPIVASVQSLQITGLLQGPAVARRTQVERQAAENDLVIVREGWGYPGPFIKTGETKGRAFKSSLFFCVFYS